MAENPCWDGYEQIGMKMKNGKKVPNCVPVKRAKNLTTLEEQTQKIKSAGLSLVAEANSTFSGTRSVTKGIALKVVERSLARTEGETYSIRKHQALTELTHFISLLQHNKTLGDKALNADLLPIGHPASSRSTSVSVASMMKARARWISDDPHITDDSVKTLIASAFTAHPASAEYTYTMTRLASLPQGTIPQYALVAALGDGNSSAARRARAMRQRRDRKGRFAEMGGGLKALVRRLDGVVRNLTGSPVSQSEEGDFTVELPDGRLVKIPASAGEGVKAFIPSKRAGDGYSTAPAKFSSKDPVLEEGDLEFVDAPDGFRADETWGPSADDLEYYGTKIDLGKKYTDDAYDVIKFEPGDNAAVRDKFEAAQQRESEGQNVVADGKGEDGWIDYSKPVFFVQRRGDEEGRPFAAVQSWADVQDLIAQDEPRFEAGELADPSRAGIDGAEDDAEDAKTAPDKVPGAEAPAGYEPGKKYDVDDFEKMGGTIIPGGPDAPDYQVRAYKKAVKKYRKSGGDVPVDPRKKWAAFPDGTVVDIDTGELLRDSEGKVFIPEEPEELVKEKKTLTGKKKIATLPEKKSADVPDAYHEVDKTKDYKPSGTIEGAESADATDDPVELAQKFDTPTLEAALEEAVSGTPESPATGTAPLEFDKGDEMVPAEAIYDALKTKESDSAAEEVLDKVYKEGFKDKVKKLFSRKGKASEKEIVEATPEEVEATEKGVATPSFDPTDVEYPALLEGLGADEKREYIDSGDYAKWLPKDAEFKDIPEGYSTLDPEPYVDIVEAYPADAPTGFSTSPVNMSLSFTPQQLRDALRQALEPNGDRAGQGILGFETPEGEIYTAWIPGEALRDALKLQNVDTNEFIESIYAEGREGKKEPSESEAKAVLDEVVAEETPATETPSAEPTTTGIDSEESGISPEDSLLKSEEASTTEEPVTDLTLPTPTSEMHAGIFRGTPDMLVAGDIAFKDDPEREYFVVESVEKGPSGTIKVTGHYVGHESQEKTWKKTTPITFIRGEKDVPVAGELPALDRPFAKDYTGRVEPSETSPSGWIPVGSEEDIKRFLDDTKAFEEAKAASGKMFTPSIDTEETSVVPLMEPQAPRSPVFAGDRMKALLEEAGGDYEKLKELIKKEEVYHLDFETVGDGFSDNPTPIQVAIYKMKDGEPVGEPIIRFMNPDKPLASFYTDADPATILKDSEGKPISDEWLAKQAAVDEVMKEIFDIMGPNPLFVAHNVAFDGLILENYAKKLGVEWNPSSIDTLAMAEEVIPGRGGRNLKAVAKRYGIEDKDWHDAAVDAEVLPTILDGLLTDMAAKESAAKHFEFDARMEEYSKKRADFDAMLDEYQKFASERAMAKAWADITTGKPSPTIEEVVEDAKLKPSTPTVDEITPATDKPDAPLSKTKFESILGGEIANEWVEDDENTTALGKIRPSEMMVGDFIVSKYGGWVEVRDIKPNPDDEKKLDITIKSLSDGREGTYSYFAYSKKWEVRRRNGKLVEGAETKPIDEPAAVEAEESTPTVPTAETPATPEAPAVEVPAISDIVINFDGDLSDWEEFTPTSGASKGSGEGMFMRAPDGKEYYVKKPKSEEHARNEVLASALYEKLGIKHGRSYLAEKDGELVTVSPLIEGAEYNFSSRRGEDDIAKSAREGFIVDAWLNNWDSVGGGFDNMIILDGEVYRIDAGGALFFRARGGDKKSSLTPEVTSIDTLRDRGRNPQAASVFGGITDEELREQATKLGSLTDADIDAIVNSAINEPEDAETYKSALKARRDDILTKYGVEKSEAAPATEESAPAVEEDSDPITDPTTGGASEGARKAVTVAISDKSGSAEDALRKSLDTGELSEDDRKSVEEILSKIEKAKTTPKKKDAVDKAVEDIIADATDPSPSFPESEEGSEEAPVSPGLTPEMVRPDAEMPEILLEDEIDEITGAPDKPDEILKKLFSEFDVVNNGDGTYTLWEADRTEGGKEKRYEIAVQKNKDNTFSVIYKEIDVATGDVKIVDPYKARHSYKALKNRINASTDAANSRRKSAAPFSRYLRELERRSKKRRTGGASDTPTPSVKMTHPSADGVKEVKRGDRVWDPKRGEWATVVDVIKEHKAKKGGLPYIYTDYVRVEYDAGGKGVRVPSGRLWIADADGRVSEKALAIPTPTRASSTGKKEKTSAPSVTDTSSRRKKASDEEDEEEAPTEDKLPPRVASYRPTPLPEGLTEEELIAEIGKRIKESKKTGTPMSVDIPPGMTPSQFSKMIDEQASTWGLRVSDVSKYKDAVSRKREYFDRRKRDIAAMSDEEKKEGVRLADEIRTEGKMVIAFSSRLLSQLLSSGRFKSQFETGSSKGMLDPKRRAIFETAAMDVHPTMDKRLRPIYGHLRLADGDGAIEDPGYFQYGDLFFEMKEEVKDRATYTVGDSLYSPFAHVPLSGEASDDVKLGGYVGRYGVKLSASASVKSLIDDPYIETQTFGGVSLEDVAVVHMKKPSGDPMSDSTYRALVDAGFTVKFFK
jgi:DNA polymerase III epsilon subunit-like protein